MTMTSYERVMTALSHKNPDRPPINYDATPEMNEILKRHLKIESQEELLCYLGADIRYVAPKYIGPKEFIGVSGVSGSGKDFWGVEWKPVKNKFGIYNEISFHPLGNVKTVKEVEEYPWPSPDWFDVSHLKEEIKRINDKERRAIIFFAGGAFESPWYMRGLEQFLMDLVEFPEIAEAISRKVMKYYKERAMRAIEASDGQIDIFYSGGDIGTQKGMMLSPELWRKHIKPYSRELIKPFKEMGFKTFYHSCGSILPVIEDFIEMGLDILDPIQPKAEGMEPNFLKDKFGSRLSFHGGIDEQELLPRGTSEEVEKEVLQRIDILGRDGGYIVCAAHAIQADTPVENALTMFRAAREYRY
jgi:uroporphyrinogen decarboxylase